MKMQGIIRKEAGECKNMDDYEIYEEQCKKIREENEQLLDLFEESLKDLKPATVRRHLSNVSFYINDYLLYEDALTFDRGVRKIDDFLGYFFIRKCMWSTPGTIKSTAASIKKFYQCMLKHDKIQRADFEYLSESIKEGMPEWQALCAQYNDPEEENPFFMW